MEVIIASSPVTPDQLNDDCLSHIFSFLLAEDVITMERVCKRWQTISLLTRKKIEIYPTDLDIFEPILQKHCNSIFKLDVDLNDVENVFELIDKYCTKLLYFKLTVEKFLVGKIDMKEFYFLKNLKSLDITGEIYDDRKFWEKVLSFLEGAHNLRSFSIDDGRKHFQIRTESKRFYINGMEIDVALDWEKLLQLFLKVVKHKKGEELNFDVYDVAGFYIDDIWSISNEITALDLSKIFGDCFDGNGIEDMEFQNLKTLSFSDYISVDDSVLSDFVRKSPHLERISFRCGFMNDRCPKITDNGYRHVANLKNLKSFYTDSSKITCDALEFIAANCHKLENISCSKLTNLNRTKVISIIDLLPNLNYLQLKGFKNLTNECLKSVVETVRRRENNVKLKIFFNGLIKIEIVNRLILKDKTLYPDLDDCLTISLTLDDACKNMEYYVDCDGNI